LIIRPTGRTAPISRRPVPGTEPVTHSVGLPTTSNEHRAGDAVTLLDVGALHNNLHIRGIS
jgi:hypothetical protein